MKVLRQGTLLRRTGPVDRVPPAPMLALRRPLIERLGRTRVAEDLCELLVLSDRFEDDGLTEALKVADLNPLEERLSTRRVQIAPTPHPLLKYRSR